MPEKTPPFSCPAVVALEQEEKDFSELVTRSIKMLTESSPDVAVIMAGKILESFKGHVEIIKQIREQLDANRCGEATLDHAKSAFEGGE